MGGLMGGGPKMPVIPAPVVMPMENSAAVTEAQRKQLALASEQSGRASTILTQQDIGLAGKNNTLGGD